MTERTCRSCGGTITNIVEVMEHATDCESVLRAEDLTMREERTLRYIEHRLVEHEGRLDPEQMDHEDRNNFKFFGAAGILDVKHAAGDTFRGTKGRLAMDLVTKFTDEAWRLAGECRRLRAQRRIEDAEHDVEGL